MLAYRNAYMQWGDTVGFSPFAMVTFVRHSF